MKRLFAALLGFGAALALAQSVPNGGSITQGQVWTTPQWNTAWQAKVDVTNGILTTPSLNSPTLTTPTVTNANIGLAGFPVGTGCSILSTFGHGNWGEWQTCQNYNPTEFQIYGAQGQGKAHCQSPNTTGVVIWDSGTPFTAFWIGKTQFYMDSNLGPFTNTPQKPASVQSASQLTLSTNCRGSGSVTFHFVTTSNDGFLSVNGTTVSLVSGQPFNVFDTGTGEWIINGVPHTCSVIGLTTATCDTTGTQTNVTYHADENINDEIATFRLQKTIGVNTEENLSCTARAVGLYECITQASGTGTYWPFALGSGLASFNSTQQYQVFLQPNGDLTLGGNYGQNTILIPAQTHQYLENFLQIAPGLSTTGVPSPSIAVRACGTCAETNLNFGLDVLGAGTFSFTSQSFGTVDFQIFGVAGGTSWLAIAPSSSASPAISANGAASNLNVVLQPKGTGVTSTTGPLQLPTYAVASLPACTASIANSMAAVNNAAAPTYNGVPAGGGAGHVPVFCDGSVWTTH